MESEGEKDPKDPEEAEDLDDSECESLSSGEIREIQKQDAARLKKSPLNKRKPPAAKEPVAKQKTPTPLEGPDRSYQVIAHALKDIREKEHEREAVVIQTLCKRLRNVQPEGLLEVINDLPT